MPNADTARAALDAAERQVAEVWHWHPVWPCGHQPNASQRLFVALAWLADDIARAIYTARRADYLATLTPQQQAGRLAAEAAQADTRGT